MGKPILLCFFLVFCPSLLNAECRGDSSILSPYQWNALGDKFLKSNPDSALSCYDRAAGLYREADSLAQWLRSQYYISYCLAFNLGKPFEAVARIDEAFAHLAEWRMPANKQENEQYCSLYMIRAHINKQKTGDYIGVKKSLEKAYQVFRNSLSDTFNVRAGYLFFQMGNNYVRLLEFQSAQLAFERGIEYSKRFKAPEVAKYADYASLFITKREYEKSLAIIHEGLNYVGIPQEDSIFLLLVKAECLAHLLQWNEALDANQEVELMLVRPLEKPKKRPEYEIGLYENYGMIALGQNDYEQALAWYNKALSLAKDYPNSPTRNIAFLYLTIGDILKGNEKVEAALEAYQSALHMLLNSFVAPASQNPPDSILFAENILYKALEGKAQCFEAMGELDKSLECYELIPVVETKIRTTHLYESSSLLAVDNSRYRFEKAIGIAWELYEKTGEITYAKRAFSLSEQARGMLLLKSLLQAQTQVKHSLPDSLRERDNEIRIQLSEYEHQIAELRGSSDNDDLIRLNSLVRKRDELKYDQAVFIEQLSNIFPSYVQIAKHLSPLEMDSLPSILRSHQAFLSYFLTEKIAYVFLLDAKGAITWKETNLPDHFRDSMIQRFIEYLANGEGDGDDASLAEDAWLKENAFTLYKLLLAPVLAVAPAQPDALVIAPDDVLAFLPFDLLQYEASQGEWSDAKFPLLLRKYSISYAYSATVLSRQQQGTREHSTLQRLPFAGFAPAYSGQERDPQNAQKILNSISGQQNLVQAVQKMLGGSIFLNESATEPEFERTAPTCRVLLLAMHGFADEEKPALSRLIFGNPKKEGDPDNVLYADELQVTYLPADLAVLNACYTGRGKLQRGEGVYSVTRALTSAGVSAALMSIWELNGASSSSLMQLFFQNIKNGMPKDLALQQAKIKFLANPANEPSWHPSNWAGVLATGDSSALKF